MGRYVLLMWLIFGGLGVGYGQENTLYVLNKKYSGYKKKNSCYLVFLNGSNYISTHNSSGAYNLSSNSINIDFRFETGEDNEFSYDSNSSTKEECRFYNSDFIGYERVDLNYNLNLYEDINLHKRNMLFYYEDSYSYQYDMKLANIFYPINYYSILLPNLILKNIPSDPDDDTIIDTSNIFKDNSNNGMEPMFFRWEYLASNGRYEPLPKYSRRYNLNLSIRDIFGNDYKQVIVGKLRIRFVFSASFTDDEIYSDPNLYSFTIIQASPQIEEFTPKSTSCETSPSPDGGFTAKFDRGLNDNEVMIMSLMKNMGSDSAPDWDIKAQESTDKLTIYDYTYTWIGGINEGEYKLLYQTLNKTTDDIEAAKENASNMTNDNYNSLENKDFTISPPSTITHTSPISITKVKCHGDPTGSITINGIIGGNTTGDYEYNIEKITNSNNYPFTNKENIDINNNTLTISDIYQGEYKITIRNVGCDNDIGTVITATVGEPLSPLKLENELPIHPTGYGLDGSVTVNGSGGTEGSGYKYSIDGINYNNTTGVFTGLKNGKYIIKVKDANGCIIEKGIDIDIVEPPELKIAAGIQDSFILCKGGREASYSLSIKGGNYKSVKFDGDKNYNIKWYRDNIAGDRNEELIENIFEVPLDEIFKEAPYNWVERYSISSLKAGSYTIDVIDASNNKTSHTFEITEPDKLLITNISILDVYCYAGSDGQITANITGGRPPYRAVLSNSDYEEIDILENITGTEAVFEGLSEGEGYSIDIYDSKNCTASSYDVEDYDRGIQINQPSEELQVDIITIKEPTFFGAGDGIIEATIQDGTSADGTYKYTWVDNTGNDKVLNTSVRKENGTYIVTLIDIHAGDYYITIEDDNYSLATSKEENCSITSRHYDLDQPDKLEIDYLDVDTEISCNSDNSYDNPIGDGVLKVVGKGGVKFDVGSHYKYLWQKKVNGVWIATGDEQEDTLGELAKGDYRINIMDANGVIVGEYANDDLSSVTAEYKSLELGEYEQIKATYQTENVICYNGNNGRIDLSVTGGIGNYDITWSNGGTGLVQENLKAGIYMAYIRDSRDCELVKQIEITQTTIIEIELIGKKNPTCYGSTDGYAEINITGGVAPYIIKWNNNETTNRIENLVEGSYTATITDANNCIMTKTIELKDPFATVLYLGEDRLLCNGQQNIIDITVEGDAGATYDWISDNGFTSSEPIVTLTEAGIYTAIATTSSGCTASGTITITASSVEIDSEFLVSTEAYAGEEITIINTSQPISDDVVWIFPEQVTIVSEQEDTITIMFEEAGIYELILRSYQGDCYADYVKPLIVSEARESDEEDEDTVYLKVFDMYPNPNGGVFDVDIELRERGNIRLTLLKIASGNVVDTIDKTGKDEYKVEYDLSLSPGVYLLILETSAGRKVKKVIVL
ncbi:MAG: T9SS type A sorting domain-containing protein [Flavobacteriaceae bacterium]|nr:T9SS type A sorting domain-containing protein [Flavobacteriaceae bacterium]